MDEVIVLDVDRRRVAGGVVHVLTLARPPVNAMDSTLLVALVESLDVAASEEAVGVLLRAEGSVFSAGADLRESSDDGGMARMELFTTLYDRLTTFPVPTAVAVEGAAVGGGAEVVAACDHRALGMNATIRFPGGSMGIPVGTARLVGQVALGTAKDWLLTGRTVDAEEAHRVQFAQQVTAAGDAEQAAMTWLETTSTNDAHTVRLLKQLAHDAAGVPRRLAVENEALRRAAAGGGTPYSRSGS